MERRLGGAAPDGGGGRRRRGGGGGGGAPAAHEGSGGLPKVALQPATARDGAATRLQPHGATYYAPAYHGSTNLPCPYLAWLYLPCPYYLCRPYALLPEVPPLSDRSMPYPYHCP